MLNSRLLAQLRLFELLRRSTQLRVIDKRPQTTRALGSASMISLLGRGASATNFSYLSRNEADQLVGKPVRPRERYELVPVSGDHVGHVERGGEADWDVPGEPGEREETSVNS